MTRERLVQLADALGISPSKLSKSVGKSESYVRTMSGYAGSDVLRDILLKFPQVNAYWLILGEGEVFRGNPSTVITGENKISGSSITSSGSIDNSINVSTPPEGYFKIIRPDRTVEMQSMELIDPNQPSKSFNDLITVYLETIESQRQTIKAQELTIQLLSRDKID